MWVADDVADVDVVDFAALPVLVGVVVLEAFDVDEEVDEDCITQLLFWQE